MNPSITISGLLPEKLHDIEYFRKLHLMAPAKMSGPSDRPSAPTTLILCAARMGIPTLMHAVPGGMTWYLKKQRYIIIKVLAKVCILA